MNRTNIAWTQNPDGTPGFTWNCVVGCKAVSPGCLHCYASRLASTRLAHLPQYAGLSHDAKWTGEVRFFPEKLAEPLRHRKPAGIFVCDMGDLFHESVTNEQIAAVFGVMAATPQHRYYVLTKRAKRRREWFEWVASKNRSFPSLSPWEECCWHSVAVKVDGVAGIGGKMHIRDLPDARSWPLPNVWQGSSICTQAEADRDIPELLHTPAACRFLSVEPMLEAINVRHLDAERAGSKDCFQVDALTGRHTDMARPCKQLPKVDWVIAGGESGPHVRPFHLGWARSIRDQCKAAGVDYFFKQAGSNAIARIGDEALWPEGTVFEFDDEGDGIGSCVKLKDRAGADPAEWPDDLRGREMPTGSKT